MNKLIIILIATLTMGCAMGSEFLVGEHTVKKSAVDVPELKRRLHIRGWKINESSDTYVETKWRTNIFHLTAFKGLETMSRITVSFTLDEDSNISDAKLTAHCTARMFSTTSKPLPWRVRKCGSPYSVLANSLIDSLLR
jgi:hypothetical protein